MPSSWRPARRHATVEEIGAVLLTRIPAAVASAGAPELAALPRIPASCDGVVRTADGAAWLVEAKHRTPFAPPAKQRKELTFLGKSRKPQSAVTVNQYVQTQLQMLVMDMQRCDLISYSLGTSTIFRIQRDNSWCSVALQLLALLERLYLKLGRVPPANVFDAEAAALHAELLQRTKEGMARLAAQKTTPVVSSTSANPGPPFLDDLPDSDDQKRETSKSLGWHTTSRTALRYLVL